MSHNSSITLVNESYVLRETLSLYTRYSYYRRYIKYEFDAVIQGMRDGATFSNLGRSFPIQNKRDPDCCHPLPGSQAAIVAQ